MSKTSIAIFAALFILLTGLFLNQERAQTPAEDVFEAEPGSLLGGYAKVEVYIGVTVPINTKELNLSGRNLEGSLKAEVRLLSELRVLDISDNDFTGLPAEVGQLSELEVLNLSNNPFTGLPHELGNLQKLKQLDLRGTQYSEFDLEIIKAALPATTEILI